MKYLLEYQEFSGRLLLEGGAYGHMSHPFDDLELTFNDVIDMLTGLIEGGFDKSNLPQEKIDGLNLLITFKDGKVYSARNKGHLKNGGETSLDKIGLIDKFKDAQKVGEILGLAVDELETAFSKFPPAKLEEIFQSGRRWLNLEVVHAATANTIVYGMDFLMLHDIIEYDNDGRPVKSHKEGLSEMKAVINKTNSSIDRNFQILMSRYIDISPIPDSQNIKNKYINQINDILRSNNLTRDSRLSEYVIEQWRKTIIQQTKVLKIELEEEVVDALANRWTFDKKGGGFRELKKSLPDKFLDWATDVDDDYLDYNRRFISPIELLFLEIGDAVLQNISNWLSLSPEENIIRIRREIETARKELTKNTLPENKIKELTRHFEKLSNLGDELNIVPSEGLVFNYKGKVYKLTGKFAPINRIINTLKF